MCGIYFACNSSAHRFPSLILLDRLKDRGPDFSHSITRNVCSEQLSVTPGHQSQDCHRLTFHSTVLCLRGDEVTRQPLEDPDTGSCLCWNGEAWTVDGQEIVGNDSIVVFQKLCTAASETFVPDSYQNGLRDWRSHKVLEVLSNIAGPFAFVFFDATNGRIFYGRDALGRRSLLIRTGERSSITLCSIADPQDTSVWEEVGADRVYIFDLMGAKMLSPSSAAVKPHSTTPLPTRYLESPFPPFNREVPSQETVRLNRLSSTLRELAAKLHGSLSVRLNTIPDRAQEPSREPRVAILFSGGVDCTLLASLAHQIIPSSESIDLLNVAFENPRVVKAATKTAPALAQAYSPYSDCPDRRTGMAALHELHQTCQTRDWRFISIDVPFAEFSEHRDRIISLMRPHNTEMDLSIASALYFAARGQGTYLKEAHTDVNNYSTPARVLLSGLGADELFAGYTRHASAFDRSGYLGLVDELEKDFLRIGQRNLGRDDRVTSHWGKEVRYPYLDEVFVSWALRLPVWEKCSFGESAPDVRSEHKVEEGSGAIAPASADLEPGKRLLRALALQMGLKNVANEKKRAIQFGARTAKMESGRVKGTQTLT